MDAQERGDLTTLHSEVRAGRPDDQDRLIRAVYRGLRRTAEGRSNLHQALERLAQVHPHQARIVTLRLLGGLSVPEVTETPAVSDTTVESDWRFARAWLRGQLGGSDQ
jgi:DNA-directed RNA polymerase specialized sigma24 family protein